MLPPISPPEFFAQATLGHLAHSALPGAPVRSHAAGTSRVRRTAAVVGRSIQTVGGRARRRLS